MDFTIRLANTNILIHSVYPGVFNISKEYLAAEDATPDIEIFSDEKQIMAEHKWVQEHNGPNISVRSAERFLIQRKIAESLLSRNTLLMHGAVVAVDNSAYMFTGPSGTGKTTQIKKWLEYADGATVVNGDKPLVRVEKNGVFACGNPWRGKENMGNNIIVPLRSIIFMRRSETNRIEAASFKDIFPKLLEQTYQPKETVLFKRTLELLMKLKDHVSFYTFYFNHYKEDSFNVPFETLTYRSQK